MKDLCIIGAGPAGITAAIYALRAGIDLSIIERFAPGGQIINTYEVENYPGFADPIMGAELVSAMEQQVKRLGAQIDNREIVTIKKIHDHFSCESADGSTIECKSVIVATGARFKKLGIPGESEFTGKGVSYCATCDGAFFRGKKVAVIGGGDTALEDAHFLTKFVEKLYLIHRRDEFRGSKILQQRVIDHPKIEIIYNTIPLDIKGEKKVNTLVVQNKGTGISTAISVDGVFIFIGYVPATEMVPAEIKNEWGEILVDHSMRTSIPGLFAAGDIRSNSRHQIITAAGDGATAAMAAYDFLNNAQQ